MDNFHSLEDAVWASATPDAKTAAQLRAALEEFRSKRARPRPAGSLIGRVLHSPAAVISSFVAIGGLAFQHCSAASERRLQRAKSHLEVRAAFIDSYVDSIGVDVVKRSQTLRAAKGLGSTMLECRQDERGSWWSTIVDLGDSAAERAECEDRKRFADWVASEIELMKSDLARAPSVLNAAAIEIATQQAETGNDAAAQDPEQRAKVADAQNRIIAQQTLGDVRPKAAAPNPPPVAKDATSVARDAWQDGYSAFQRNDRVRAREHYLRALKAKPDYFAALNSLGRLALEDDGDAEGAIVYLRDAVKAKPDYAPALYNLALAYGRAKKPEACKALRDAQERAPDFANRSLVEAEVQRSVKCR